MALGWRYSEWRGSPLYAERTLFGILSVMDDPLWNWRIRS